MITHHEYNNRTIEHNLYNHIINNRDVTVSQHPTRTQEIIKLDDIMTAVKAGLNDSIPMWKVWHCAIVAGIGTWPDQFGSVHSLLPRPLSERFFISDLKRICMSSLTCNHLRGNCHAHSSVSPRDLRLGHKLHHMSHWLSRILITKTFLSVHDALCGYNAFDHVRLSGRCWLNLVWWGNWVELNPFRLSLVEHCTMMFSRFNPFRLSNVDSPNPFGLSHIECCSATFDRSDEADPSGSSGGG